MTIPTKIKNKTTTAAKSLRTCKLEIQSICAYCVETYVETYEENGTYSCCVETSVEISVENETYSNQ